MKVQIFRLATIALKFTKFVMSFLKPRASFSSNFASLSTCHVIFQATSQFSLKLRFGQKEPIKVQIFKFLSALMKVHQIPHASFETTRSRFIQILHHCSVSCLLCIFYLKPLYFRQKEPIEVKFSEF